MSQARSGCSWARKCRIWTVTFLSLATFTTLVSRQSAFDSWERYFGLECQVSMISLPVQALLYRSIATVLGISQKLSEKGGFEKKNGRKIYHDRGNSMDYKHSIRSMGVQQHPTYSAITYEKKGATDFSQQERRCGCKTNS